MTISVDLLETNGIKDKTTYFSASAILSSLGHFFIHSNLIYLRWLFKVYTTLSSYFQRTYRSYHLGGLSKELADFSFCSNWPIGNNKMLDGLLICFILQRITRISDKILSQKLYSDMFSRTSLTNLPQQYCLTISMINSFLPGMQRTTQLDFHASELLSHIS